MNALKSVARTQRVNRPRCNPFSLGIVFVRQNLTSTDKDGPHTEIIKILI